MKRLLSCSLLIALLAVYAPNLQAEEGSSLSGIGSLRFTIEGPDESPETIGSWTLIRPGNERTEGTDSAYEFQEIPAGKYTFTISLPEGTGAESKVLLNGKQIKEVSHPQVSFDIDGMDAIVLSVKLSFTQVGTAAVNSDPRGLGFRLKGPDNLEKTGTTPASFEGVPIGQYTAYFDEIEGCPTIPPQSDRLTKDSRISLSVSISCDNLDESELEYQEEKSLEFVTVSIEGRNVVFSDVRIEEWFAPYIYTTAKLGIITGYKDRSGNPNGQYGPGDNVTVAQLAKIAHELTGIDEEKIRVPVQNARAKNQWFEKYFASAEQRWWEVYQDKRVDPSRNATRAEVIVTLLRALNVDRTWAEGKTFSDVSPNDTYASAIETAARDGLVDAGGAFRPKDSINRAEISKIIAKAMELYIENTSEIQG